jgi:hypothetical protein
MQTHRLIRLGIIGIIGILMLCVLSSILHTIQTYERGLAAGPPSPDEITLAAPQTVNDRHAELVQQLHDRGRQERIERLMTPTGRAAARRLWLLPTTWEGQYGGDAIAVDDLGVEAMTTTRVGVAVWAYPDTSVCLLSTWTQNANGLWYVRDYTEIPDCTDRATAVAWWQSQ